MRQQNEKGELDSFINRWMSWTSVETALFSFSLSLAALCLWLNCMDVRTCPKPSMQQEQQPSPQYQSINQSIIISNSLSLFCLSHFHTDCFNQGLDQEEVVNGVQNEKGLPYCPKSRQTVERHIRSRHKTAYSVCSIYLSL